MAVKSAMAVVNMKKGHFGREDARIDKYTLADELSEKLSELALRPKSMAASQPSYSYTVRTIMEYDKEKVLDFLRKFFFRDEPMNKAVNLIETPESRCLELEEYVSSCFDENMSVVAVDDNGEIVGVIINGVVTRDDKIEDGGKAEECPNPKFQRILRVLEHLDKHARIWDKLPEECHTVVEMRVASTHSAWRGRGLMKVLCDETERKAREIGAGAMRMDTTSAFSAAAAERLHYKSVYSTLYADLPFAPQPAAPHLGPSVYIKEL